ncbi:MAG: S-methyl-5-thioribose kinase [Firmicutes bacterium HGW-Firmicutes-2]|jgi:5-methylthioribose kinase|nr:MAG: S-methyl-5-thioribose kinase [Firmicutes bacterium HGW-Firmicutes-2]
MNKYVELNENTVVEYVKSKISFFDEDAVYVCNEIGDGNLNLVFRVKDTKNEKSIIVKQALPYVRAAGENWPLDIRRGEIETHILNIEYELTGGLVPKVYFYDTDMYCMAMEDLDNYIIMRYGLLEFNQYPNFAEQISDFLVKTLLLTSDVVMEHKEKKENVKSFINPQLCEITEDLVYTEPFHIGARNNIEEALQGFHKEEIVDDEELAIEVAKLKYDFMNNAQALLHGDLHTGSIFVNQDSTKVIDPEFAFYGPMAYDVGALIANLIMNYISTKASLDKGELRSKHEKFLLDSIRDVVDMFKAKFLNLWDDAVTDKMAKSKGFKEYYINDVLVNAAGVAGCEMVRRTVGFAHVKDLDGITDNEKRIKAKKENLHLAKILIKNRTEIVNGEEYIRLIEKYL